MPDLHGLDPYAMWRRALARMDEVFASPPGLDNPVMGCTYCMAESELPTLGGDPAAVPDELLGHFMREVVDHWDPDQYPILWRRLMPRAVRAWGPGGRSTELALEIGRLGRHGAGLADWPAPERAAVEDVFRALAAIAVTDGRPAWDITDLIEGIAGATDGPQPWLAYIAGLSGPEADAGLVRLAVDWAADLLWDDFHFWWYDGDPRVIADWLVTQHDRIGAFAARHPRCKNAADAVTAVDHLRDGKGSPWLYPYVPRTLPSLLPSQRQC